MTLKNKRGFTLTELVLVIVLIGILAITVLPKFANITTQAYTAVNRGVAGDFESGIAVASADWKAQGAPPASGTITFEGNTVYMTLQGWPSGNVNLGGEAVNSAAGCGQVWTLILTSPPQAVQVAGSCTGTAPCYLIGFNAGVPGVCTYTMYPGGSSVTAVSPSTTITYNGNTGGITVTP